MMISKSRIERRGGVHDEDIYEVFMTKLEKKGINILSKNNHKKMEKEYIFINMFINKLVNEDW